ACWSACRPREDAGWTDRALRAAYVKKGVERPLFCLIDRERLAATAGRGGVGILDGESAAGDSIDEIDLRPFQVPHADGIDEQLDAVRLEHLIAGTLAVFLDHQTVLEARAAASLHENPKAAAGLLFFGEKLVDFVGRRFRHVNHGLCLLEPRSSLDYNPL